MGGSASSLLDENKSKYIKGKEKLNNRESLRLKFWYALGERRNEGAAHSSARFIEHRWREWAVSVGFRATFHITVFGVEALEAVSLRINIRSAILIWIVMPVWAFFYVKMWVRVGNSSRRFSREPSIRLLAKLSVWLCLVIFNQAFCPSPNKLSGGGAGDTLHVFFMAKTLVHAFITSAWLVWGAHGGHSSISSTARKKENQRDRTFFLFSLFLLGVSRGVD